jgi:hypothetical protein
MVVWRKASQSGSTSDCVEVSNTGLVRDSKDPRGRALRVEVATLVATLASGRLRR